MAYTILSFGVLLPVATLATAFLLEWKQNLGGWRWASMGFFSLMYAAALWATFVLSTFLGVANIAIPSLYTFLVGLCPSAVGVALGWLVRNKKLNVNVPFIGNVMRLSRQWPTGNNLGRRKTTQARFFNRAWAFHYL